MSVTKTATTIYVCDRCGHTADREFARGGSATLQGQVSFVAYDGAAGGTSIDVFLCGACADAFRSKFMNNQATSPTAGGEGGPS